MMPAPSKDNVPARGRAGNGAPPHPAAAPPADPWPDPPDPDGPPTPPQTLSGALTPAGDVIDALVSEWESPTRPTPTGLRQLDELLHGGVRPGDLIGVTGPAAGGKSALTGQLALDLAKAGAVVLYASVEMPGRELVARWMALEAFRATSADAATAWAIDYASVLYGATYRGEGFTSEATRAAALARLDAARRAVTAVGARLYPQQVAPRTTVAQLRDLVAAARAREQPRPLVLVVDPLQRLFASHGEHSAKVTDALNASETERVGAVAQELKYLADTEALTVLFTSDTTKAAATGVLSSAGALRGSYQINHLATTVLGLFTGQDPKALRAKLQAVKDGEPVAPELREQDIEALALPAWWRTRADVSRLGGRVAVLECSKNRRGRPRALALGFVPGAACFVEGPGCNGATR
jgi:RecA/RadA recombinase